MKDSGILSRLKKNWASRSIYGKITDVIFYLLIIGMIIPGSRKIIATGINRLAMHRPQSFSDEILGSLGNSDYDWKLVSSDGSQVVLRQYRDQVIFLNFWATWCPPCRAELPNIQRLYEQYNNRMVFLLVTQEDPAVVQAFLDEKGYSMPFYLPAFTPPQPLQTPSLPTTFIIDRNGKIVFKKTGAFRWDSKKTGEFLDNLLR